MFRISELIIKFYFFLYNKALATTRIEFTTAPSQMTVTDEPTTERSTERKNKTSKTDNIFQTRKEMTKKKKTSLNLAIW